MLKKKMKITGNSSMAVQKVLTRCYINITSPMSQAPSEVSSLAYLCNICMQSQLGTQWKLVFQDSLLVVQVC